MDRQQRYHTRYGAKVWHLQYQAEVRSRREMAKRIYAEGLRARSRAGDRADLHEFSLTRPWQYVYEKLVDCADWWKEEFEEPAQLLLTRLAHDCSIIGGDAPVGHLPVAPAVAASLDRSVQQQQQPPPSLQQQQQQQRGSKRAARGGHNVVEGMYTSNRGGVEICELYNRGQCHTDPRWPGRCPVNWHRAHQCNKCLGQHPANPSDGSKPCELAPKENSRTKFLSKKGGGKGKKGGKQP